MASIHLNQPRSEEEWLRAILGQTYAVLALIRSDMTPLTVPQHEAVEKLRTIVYDGWQRDDPLMRQWLDQVEKAKS